MIDFIRNAKSIFNRMCKGRIPSVFQIFVYVIVFGGLCANRPHVLAIALYVALVVISVIVGYVLGPEFGAVDKKAKVIMGFILMNLISSVVYDLIKMSFASANKTEINFGEIINWSIAVIIAVLLFYDVIWGFGIYTSLRYYIVWANIYKFAGGFVAYLSVALPAVSTFVAFIYVKNIDVEALAYVTPVLTMVITIISGINAFGRFEDKKQSCREATEKLKSVLSTFQAERYGLELVGKEKSDLKYRELY